MPKTKRFIDKKNAVTFNLVHRSQKDPLAADEDAPQRVLVPISRKAEKTADADANIKVSIAIDPAQKKKAQVEFGIFFEDDYDYMQHLKDVTQTMEWELVEDNANSRVWKAPAVKGISNYKLNLPSSVFQSQVEEEVGLLNRAAPHSGPRPDLDPDVVAALDDDFNFEDPENELEDDFIALANAKSNSEPEYSQDEDCDDSVDELDDMLGDLRSVGADSGEQRWPNTEDENKSRFTEYSMTSSVIRRNEQLSLLDDRFEQLMAQYDDDEMGALHNEEIEGYIEPKDSRLMKLAEEFENERMVGFKLNEEIGKTARAEVEGALEKYLENYDSEEVGDSSSSGDDDMPERKWDCESILSTYSNAYNHPKLISEPSSTKIKVCAKTGVPLDVLGKPGLTRKYLNQLDHEAGLCDDGKCADTRSIISSLSTISIRAKDETPEQRKERKQLVKEYRRERRTEKKANTIAFKEEKKLQEKQALNNRINVHGMKLM
nr:EOG090X08PQ [Ilyocryptus agilis]